MTFFRHTTHGIILPTISATDPPLPPSNYQDPTGYRSACTDRPLYCSSNKEQRRCATHQIEPIRSKTHGERIVDDRSQDCRLDRRISSAAIVVPVQAPQVYHQGDTADSMQWVRPKMQVSFAVLCWRVLYIHKRSYCCSTGGHKNNVQQSLKASSSISSNNTNFDGVCTKFGMVLLH